MTVLTPTLHDTLRALKLTGMLDTLDARVAQARTGALGHLDFLQVLCEDEIARRETAALARRLRLARFEEQATMESFDFTANPKVPAAALRDLAALRWLDAGESIILYGPTGVGKTHIAQGLGHNVIRRGAQVRFIKTSRVLADLAGGHADRTWERRLREYTRPAVLILDDFAMRELTAPQADDLYELVSERAIQARPLILTSNRAPTDPLRSVRRGPGPAGRAAGRWSRPVVPPFRRVRGRPWLGRLRESGCPTTVRLRPLVPASGFLGPGQRPGGPVPSRPAATLWSAQPA